MWCDYKASNGDNSFMNADKSDQLPFLPNLPTWCEWKQVVGSSYGTMIFQNSVVIWLWELILCHPALHWAKSALTVCMQLRMAALYVLFCFLFLQRKSHPPAGSLRNPFIIKEPQPCCQQPQTEYLQWHHFCVSVSCCCWNTFTTFEPACMTYHWERTESVVGWFVGIFLKIINS